MINKKYHLNMKGKCNVYMERDRKGKENLSKHLGYTKKFNSLPMPNQYNLQKKPESEENAKINHRL